MDSCTVVANVLEATRICKVCGAEKPIGDFDLQNGYYRRICRECYHPRLLGIRKGWYYRHREAILKSRKECYQVYRESMMNRVRERRRDSHFAEQELIANRERYTRMRKMALGYYGSKCECCGETGYAMLTFDHINGGGRKSGLSGLRFVNDIIKEYNRFGYPNGKYRILCWNCNLARSNCGYCPHNGRPEDVVISLDTQRGRKIKLEFIAEYGGRCQVCGEGNWEFLTVDHINGGGMRHMRSLKKGGARFYSWLKGQGWPKDEYQLLCFNCNCGKLNLLSGGR